MIKRSTLFSLIIYVGAIESFCSAISTMFFLVLIKISEPKAIKILCAGMAFGALLYTIDNLRNLKSRICKRIANRRDGILEDPILTNHGDTIADVICGIRHEPVEYLAYFMPNGEKIGESTLNSPHETVFPPEKRRIVRKMPGCISVHNHPSDEIIAFSPNDIFVFAFQREQYAIVVTKELLFVMKAPDNKCRINPWMVRHVAIEAYVGDDYATASLASCEAVSKRFGYQFYAIPFPGTLLDAVAMVAKF